MTDLQNLLALAAVPHIGAARLNLLIKEFGTPEKVFRARVSDLTRLNGISPKIASDILKNRYQEDAARQLEKLKGAEHVVLYCSNGRRTRQAEQVLLDNMFDNVFHLQDGLMGWRQQGFTLTTGWAP